MRARADGHVIFRVITGMELMSVIGWDPRFFVQPKLETHKVLSSLAGNAFSAFAVQAVLVSLFVHFARLAAVSHNHEAGVATLMAAPEAALSDDDNASARSDASGVSNLTFLDDEGR